MPVKIIKAKKQITPSGGAADRGVGSKKLRVAAYCRVSTDSEEQENSYEAQKQHYENLINSHDDWTLVGIFADQGISGTSAKKRPEFLRMIKACESGEVDRVLTKSISRFSRNTVDTLKYIRLLKGLNISIFFEKENIDTLDASGEIMITVLSAISQQESQSISENVRLGHMYNFQQGKAYINSKYFYGYDKGPEEHTMVINPEQAKVVRRIYRLFLEGFSPAMIAKGLNEEGVPTATGSGKWFDTTVASILTNEKHCGDLLLQKYYTTDFLSHKLVRNRGERQQYFVEDDHDPIVPKEIFYQVQGEIRRRSFLKSDPNRVRYGRKNAILTRIYCGKCGAPMRRFKKKNTDWRCGNRVVGQNCDMEIVKESEIHKAIVTAFNELQRLLPELIKEEAKVHNGEMKSIDAILEHLTEEEETLTSSDGEALARIEEEKNHLFHKRADLANQLVLIRDLREFAERRKPTEDDGSPCSSYEDFFDRTCYVPPKGVVDSFGEVLVFDNGMAQRFLERVMVYPEKLVVGFKAGIEVEVER